VELLRALAVLAEPPVPETARVAAALGLDAPSPVEFADVFVFQLPPYASVYLGPEGQLGGEAEDRVCGFYRALGIEVDREPDHLATLLGVYTGLAEAGAAGGEPIRRARFALLSEHLVSWLPVYLAAVQRLAPPPLARWASMLDAVLREEAGTVPEPAALPLHLRAAPALPAVVDGAEAWLDALLAPVRSGLILTRADLARGARELGLGVRAGERRFALRALLGQAPREVVAWLAGEAEDQARRHAADGAAWPAAAEDWSRRATATARALRQLSIEEPTHV
jgi:hypothetical protein